MAGEALDRESEDAPQVDPLNAGRRDSADEGGGWDLLAPARAPAIDDGLHLGGVQAITMLASRLKVSATACISSSRLAWWAATRPV